MVASRKFILIKCMLKSIGVLVLVHSREVVRFSESLLREVPLYMCISIFSCSSHTSYSVGTGEGLVFNNRRHTRTSYSLNGGVQRYFWHFYYYYYYYYYI